MSEPIKTQLQKKTFLWFEDQLEDDCFNIPVNIPLFNRQRYLDGYKKEKMVVTNKEPDKQRIDYNRRRDKQQKKQ